jgi:MFS family permease
MMTVINITSPLGQVVGYAIGTFNVPEKWPYSFALVGCLIWGIGSVIIISPSRYFSARYSWAGYQDGDKLVTSPNERTGNSIFISGEIVTKKKAKGGSMLEILKKGAFIFSSYTRANLLFIFQVIHLFITDYAMNGLKIQDKKEILKYYGPASVLGPTLGGSFGGFVSTSVGGYENKKSVWVCIGFGTLTLLMTFPLSFGKSMQVVGACLFGFFFCASAVLPTIVGYIISSIPKAHKGAGSSLNLLISTLAGNLPGPIIYGFINDRMKATNPTFAWKCTIFYFFLGYCSLLLACFTRYRDLVAKEQEEKNPEVEIPKTN